MPILPKQQKIANKLLRLWGMRNNLVQLLRASGRGAYRRRMLHAALVVNSTQRFADGKTQSIRVHALSSWRGDLQFANDDISTEY